MKARKKTQDVPQHRELTAQEDYRGTAKKEPSRTNLKAVPAANKSSKKSGKKTVVKEKPKSMMVPVVGFSLLLSVLIIVGVSQRAFLSKALAEVARALLRSETEYTSPYQYPGDESSTTTGDQNATTGDQNATTGQTTGLEDLKDPPPGSDTTGDTIEPAMDTGGESGSSDTGSDNSTGSGTE